MCVVAKQHCRASQEATLHQGKMMVVSVSMLRDFQKGIYINKSTKGRKEDGECERNKAPLLLFTLMLNAELLYSLLNVNKSATFLLHAFHLKVLF